MFGGPTVQIARIRKQKLDYPEIGEWIDKQLKKHNVWVVLMPSAQFGKPFVRGLEHNSSWSLVFLNNKQKLFIDITTPQGRELFAGISNGKTLYPDDFSRNLIIAHYLLLPGKGKATHKLGLDFAIKAFKLNPSQAPMQKIMFAARFAELKPHVNAFCKDYFDNFTKNKNLYAKQNSYSHRIVAALVVSDYLQRVAKKQKNAKLVEYYATEKQEYENERKRVLKRKRW